ncbi:hypothetical protein LBMAG56_48840 [Verrucomicrobiota bacterium]|nr:hypothetical protein LBMAG56_48840 [Verrucomicrobiota bacterium]
MKLTYGLALDGYKPRQPCFNHQFCGPAGLVKAMELRLGLAAREASPATRTCRFLAATEACAAEGEKFFSKSLLADRWGSAAALLSIRDNLRMAGWSGEFDPCAPPRLRDLAAIERQAQGTLPPGLADRMAAVRAVLAQSPGSLPEVECVDDEAHLPWLLRGLLRDLNTRYLTSQPTAAPKGSNLEKIQEFLSGKSPTGGEWDAADDSMILATAHSEITLAHAAARLSKQAGPDTALVATAPGGLAGEVLHGLQSPSPALENASTLRPVMQVLRLALEMRWDPPDPSVILSFLRQPVCPLGAGLRHGLAKAVCDRPGIGSTVWHEAIEKERQKVIEREEGSPEKRDAALKRIDRDMDDWILVERYGRQPGAPGSALAETVSRVAHWAGRMAGASGAATMGRHFRALASIATELAEILQEIAIVSPDELAHILELVSGDGTNVGDQAAELGCRELLHDPGAAIEGCGTILWWGFEKPGGHPAKVWTTEERAYLAEHGIHLQDAGELLAMNLAMASRPFLAARVRIVLLWPRERGLESIEPHLLLTRLRSAFPAIPVLDLDEDKLPGATSKAKVEVPLVTLPRMQRWLHLSKKPALPPRDAESYSSAQKFVFRPFMWVLDYQAKLKRPNQINLATQRGNLLHRVVERLLAADCAIDWRTLAEADFGSWLETIWGELLRTEGANYLLPGGITEGRRLYEEARRSTWGLIVHLRKAGVVNAVADLSMPRAPLGDVAIKGVIDLLAVTTTGRAAVVDLKYGRGKAKRDELSNNTALQLAVYSHLVKARNGGGWPATAYFILRSNELLAQDASFFPHATIVKCNHGSPGPESTWKEFLDVWRWRRNLLEEGWIEVPVDGTSPTEGDDAMPASAPPHEEWRPDESAPRYDDYRFLTGWKDTP